MSDQQDLPGVKLSQLPGLQPPRDVFDDVMAATRHQRRQPVSRHRWLPLSAAAAALVALAVITGLALRVEQREQELAGWIDYSQELEAQLRQMQDRSQVMNGHWAATVSSLAGELAQVDWALAQRPRDDHQLRLWQARAGLLNELVSVHASGHWLNQPRGNAPIVTPGPPTQLAANEL